MALEKVKVYGMWVSPFALRVEWALKLKGVEYEYINEDLPHNKSAELLRYNPITKKIPVLVHGEKAIAESLVIVEYIDEVWSDGFSILPEDPCERAEARFWAKFAEDKCLPACFEVYCKTGEELQRATLNAQENLKTLEKAVQGKKFFGGEEIGYLDVAVGWISYWLRMVEDLAQVSVVNNESLPLMNAWTDEFLNVEMVKQSLPPKDRLYDWNRVRREQFFSGEFRDKK